MIINAHAVSPVVDPALAPRTQWRLWRLIARKTWPASKLLIERLGPIVLAICILGAFANRLTDPWLLAVAASACATFATRREVRFAGLRRHRQSFVEPTNLDDASLQRLRVAQTAIETVLTSEVYRTGRPDSAVSAGELKQHE